MGKNVWLDDVGWSVISVDLLPTRNAWVEMLQLSSLQYCFPADVEHRGWRQGYALCGERASRSERSRMEAIASGSRNQL